MYKIRLLSCLYVLLTSSPQSVRLIATPDWSTICKSRLVISFCVWRPTTVLTSLHTFTTPTTSKNQKKFFALSTSPFCRRHVFISNNQVKWGDAILFLKMSATCCQCCIVKIACMLDLKTKNKKHPNLLQNQEHVSPSG